MKFFAWQTTLPHPWKRSHTHCADQGQVGWKLHAIPCERGEDSPQLKGRAALCGVRAKHGWGMDLFIDAECSRCAAKVLATGDTMQNIAEVMEAERRANACPECGEDARKLTACPVEYPDCKQRF